MVDGGIDKHPLRTLAVYLALGVSISVLILLSLLAGLTYVGVKLDSSIVKFYPIIAVAGAVFGFERWWAFEQGEYNPFHE